MTNSFLHTGLHILEKDLQNFYKDVLNCETIRSFTVTMEDAFSIFGIKQEVTAHLVSCGGIELELFIGEKTEAHTFGHICFQSTQAEEIFEKSKTKGFNTFVRKKNSNTTYFISDKNKNLFEIKKKNDRFFKIENSDKSSSEE